MTANPKPWPDPSPDFIVRDESAHRHLALAAGNPWSPCHATAVQVLNDHWAALTAMMALRAVHVNYCEGGKP